MVRSFVASLTQFRRFISRWVSAHGHWRTFKESNARELVLRGCSLRQLQGSGQAPRESHLLWISRVCAQSQALVVMFSYYLVRHRGELERQLRVLKCRNVGRLPGPRVARSSRLRVVFHVVFSDYGEFSSEHLLLFDGRRAILDMEEATPRWRVRLASEAMGGSCFAGPGQAESRSVS